MRKEDAKYDVVPNTYWREAFFKKIAVIFRGTWKSRRFSEKGKMFCCGKNTEISCAKYMYVGDKVIIGKNVKIQAFSKDGIKLHDNTQIGDNTIINGTSLPDDPGVGLEIGANSAFGEFCYFGCAGGIKIGEEVIAGQNVRFHAENHEYADIKIPIHMQGVTRKGIEVGSNCWIGAGAVFLDGTKVGNGCVIGANTLLKGTYPENSVIVGIPGKVIKMREQL